VAVLPAAVLTGVNAKAVRGLIAPDGA